ncbi:hypothetical protein PENSOL_c001G03940 [Penicillium solitum]|uniref:Uncharacterized protein n=1 Tax=Penicillium solitum TaxID=60172 RepID=A0A1V6RQ21_9EURO|nr:uncharacterized protein PENSOL_c001G03940 [Penicillium solitum]OQE03882.1 hypothetical protein PENSOL_c001G03940 [Penicillium solitum]
MSTAPTPSTKAYLPACNGQVNLRQACTWSLTQIEVFMIEVIDNHSTYGVERMVVSELKRLRTDILDLSENGSRYQSEPLYPQAISRTVNPAAANEDEPYFFLDELTYGGVSYWSSFDLLAPMPPWVYSCVWAEQKDKQSRFHLGGSLAGYRNPEGQGNRWVKVLQRARFNVLRDQRIDTAGVKFELTALRGRGGHPIPFGNCAETYPLANVLRNRAPSEEVYGFAVMLNKLPKDGPCSHSQALDAMTKPCTNCQQVINTWGGKVENFITDDMPDKSIIPTFGVQSPTSPSDPRASGSKIDLPARPKRASPVDDTDEPTAKSARGSVPEVPKKPSHLDKGKGKQRPQRDLYQPDLSAQISLEEYGGLRMNMLYDLVAKSSDEAAAFFYWMMYWSHPGLERSSIKCDPDIQMDREPYYLEAMMSANARMDIVLDTWNSLYLEPHLRPQFGRCGVGVGVQSVRTHTPDEEDGDL